MFTKKKSWLRFAFSLGGVLVGLCVFLYGHYTGRRADLEYGVVCMIVMFLLAAASVFFGFRPEE